jgi:hypothetical protein
VSREERIVKNEALFREVNERIDEVTADRLPRFEIVCECGENECRQMLEVTSGEYSRVRDHPTRFFVLRGHEIPDVETIIESTDRFNVVEKHVDQEQIARITD